VADSINDALRRPQDSSDREASCSRPIQRTTSRKLATRYAVR
jgi:hypothetical protein